MGHIVQAAPVCNVGQLLSTFAKANVLGRSGSYVVQEPFLPPDANWLAALDEAGVWALLL